MFIRSIVEKAKIHTTHQIKVKRDVESKVMLIMTTSKWMQKRMPNQDGTGYRRSEVESDSCASLPDEVTE